MSFLTQSHGDDWPSRQWSWYGEIQLMSSWTRSPNRHCNVSLALIQVSFKQPDLKLKDVFFFLFHYMKAVITKVLLCHRLHSAVVIMEDVITWRRRPAVIPRSGHKSEAEWFVAAGQSSCGKRQMWDSGSIWAKPHWCQQTDRRWRHIRDQQHPENSWSEPEGGADSRLAAASCQHVETWNYLKHEPVRKNKRHLINWSRLIGEIMEVDVLRVCSKLWVQSLNIEELLFFLWKQQV